MTTTASAHDVHHAPGPTGGWRLLYKGGLLRAAWMLVLFGGIGFGLVVLARWAGGWHPILATEPLVLVAALVAAPIGFLAGVGAFDYWAYYALGFPTREEDHSGHGARSWRDYFRVNTDHKVIGIQYMVTTFFFFLAGGMLALLVRAELAKPGMQFFDNQTFNGLFSVHASLMIFLFVIPAFAGLANFAVPLMLGAGDMAFPRLNALSYWLYLLGGVVLWLSWFASGGTAKAGWWSYPTLSEAQFSPGHGQDYWILAIHILTLSSLAGAINFLVTIHNMRSPGMTWMRLPLFVWSIETYALLLLLALLIRLTSKGPVLYRQVRCGLGGRKFTLCKFRSMHPDADLRREELDALNEMDGPAFKIRNDPRCTAIGSGRGTC